MQDSHWMTLTHMYDSGMAPIIRAVLSALIGEEDSKDIEIVSNDVDIHKDGTWSIKYRHPTRYVHFV